jgi:predicted amidohydrolase
MPLARAAMHARGEVLHVAQWPGVKALHQLASRHYAFEGQCFVAAAGCVLSRGDILEGVHSLGRPPGEALELLEALPGSDEELLLPGGSGIIAPNADHIAGPVYGESCILYAEIQPGRITEGHLELDIDGHYSRPDVFHLEVNDRPQLNVTFTSQTGAPHPGPS